MPLLDACSFWLRRVVAPSWRRRARLRPWRVIALAERKRVPRSDASWRRPAPFVQFAAHPATCGTLVLMYPGLNATMECESRSLTRHHADRYRRLAGTLQQQAAAAVLRLPNPQSGYDDGGETAVECLRRATEYALLHARSLCGHRHPALCFWGFSAGAGAAAALASDYQPQRLVLVSPAWDAGPERIQAGLAHFTGELVILVGEGDEIIGQEAACLFNDHVPAARRKQVILVPGCDHFFTRDDHDALLHKTTLREFATAAPPRR